MKFNLFLWFVFISCVCYCFTNIETLFFYVLIAEDMNSFKQSVKSESKYKKMILRVSNIWINILLSFVTTNVLTANNWPEFTPKAIISAGVYVVTQEYTITTDMTMQEGVSLIFDGGKLTGNAKITGNYTQIIASKVQIFDTTLSFDGVWNIDRAYPEWFGGKPSTEDAESPVECGIAINKAIELKRVGEVYLSRGDYYVAFPIKVMYGIILCGEKAVAMNEPQYGGSTIRMWPSDEMPNPNKIKESDPDTIDPLINFEETNNFVVAVNINFENKQNLTWEKSYPAPLTAIRNIYFFNGIKHYASLRGVLFAGGIEITHCRWWNFAQAVQSDFSVYADNKIITDCQFDNNTNGVFGDLYAFDLSGLGDNLTFKRNHITRAAGNYKYNGLRVDKTNGAEICNNIINAPILIKNSKAISFASNHLEGDATQLTIQQSIVQVSNNFFEKGIVPSLVIKEGASNYDISTISLVDNAFLYYENESSDVNAYDLKIDGKVSLDISNSYRYWIKRDMVSKMYPIGLKMCDESDNAIDTFNKYSYFLSTKGLLKTASAGANVCISCNNALNTGNVTWTAQTNDQVIWKEENGTYTYSAILIWDKDRKIIHPKVNIPNGKENKTNDISLTRGGSGVLLWMDGANDIGHQAMVRLIRTGNGAAKYVDLPFVGTHFIYDNGISICGFPWQDADSSITDITGIMPIGAIEFVGNNVICRSKTKPSSIFGWQNGDIVYNLGPETNAIWILSDNTWISK